MQKARRATALTKLFLLVFVYNYLLTSQVFTSDPPSPPLWGGLKQNLPMIQKILNNLQKYETPNIKTFKILATDACNAISDIPNT